MPVILGDKESVDSWLDGSSASNFDKLLKPYEGHDLVWYPVTPAMGKVSFDGPECSNEIQLKAESTNSITKFFSTKGTKKEEIIPKDTSLHNSSVRTDIIERVKEEPATKGERAQTSSTVKIEEPETKEERVQPSSTVKCEEESETKEETAQPSTGKCEEEPETEDRVKCEEPETAERVKCEEPETEERVQPSSTVKCEDVKGMVSQLSQEHASKGKTKRNYDELLVDSKPVLKEADKKYGGSPAKKKVNLKASHDKQPTLFSYFGKS